MNEKERRLNALKSIKKDYLQWLDDNWDSFLKDSSIKEKFDYHEGDTRRIAKFINLNDGRDTSFVEIVFDIRVTTSVKAYPKLKKENNDVKDN